MALSNRAKKRMIDKAMYCKATGDLKQSINLLKIAIADERKQLGIYTPKLKSKSFVEVPQRVEVTKSNQAYYNKGDYYFSDLNCIFKRA
jgi:hypothetical protein